MWIAKGKGLDNYATASSEKTSYAADPKLKNNPAYKPEDVTGLENLYDSFLVEFPKYYAAHRLRLTLQRWRRKYGQ